MASGPRPIEWPTRDGRPEGAVRITSRSDTPGLSIRDGIERRRRVLHTQSPVTPVAVTPEIIPVPVDVAVKIRTESVTVSELPATFVRRGGSLVEHISEPGQTKLPAGSYVVDLSGTINLYLVIDGPLTIDAAVDQTCLSFDGQTKVIVGARSLHRRPAATVTTTAAPEDVMAAVSTLGSAFKTTTPDRTYPTLRGHPPAIELGSERSIPDLDAPDTGIEIELPPDLSMIYPVAPLAAYLGASVVPGERSRIVTETGFERPLGASRAFETDIEQVLLRTFFLDCLARTEGYYQIDLHERTALEPYIDLDFAALYDAPLSERVAAYDPVPFDVLAGHIPDWALSAQVTPSAEHVALLPHLVDELATIRTADERPDDPPALDDSAGAHTDGLDRQSSIDGSTTAQVAFQTGQSFGSATFDPAVVEDAHEVSVDAYRNHLARDLSDGNVTVTVVMNDDLNTEIDLVEAAYGSGVGMPLDLTIQTSVTTDELRDVFAVDQDFLHYVGHVGEGGFACADGRLDVTSLSSVGVAAFLLNGCCTYREGAHLIEAGAVGGVVTRGDVINSGAVRMGATLARLLDVGFPLRSALSVARSESIVGSQYTVVGDGSFTLRQADGGAPISCSVEAHGDGFLLETTGHLTRSHSMGSLIKPYVAGVEEYYLLGGPLGIFHVSRDELASFLSLAEFPVRIDGQLHWSDELPVSEL